MQYHTLDELIERRVWNEAARDFEFQMREEAKIAAHVKQLAEEWQAKYPNYCRECNGWGGQVFYQGHPYGSTTAYEQLYDGCECEPFEQCHRCGAMGLDEDGNGPCTSCNWNYDDGLPEY